jgi:glyoxylase-like metal-dependent hydrolase (beta-lactamase superfamily II)
MTCTATGLRDEIRRRFNVPVKYVVFTHGHADHISGGQIFQNDGALVVANQRALEPIIGEKFQPQSPIVSLTRI